MKKHYWVILGIALAFATITVVWNEKLRSESKLVIIAELVLPRPEAKPADVILLDVLNTHLKSLHLVPVAYFQGFEVPQPGHRILAGNFSHSQIASVANKLEILSRKDKDVTFREISQGLLRRDHPLEFREGATITLQGEKDDHVIEGIVHLSPEAPPMTGHFFDGHTILFAEFTDEKLKILFVTVITPSDSALMNLVNAVEDIFD